MAIALGAACFAHAAAAQSGVCSAPPVAGHEQSPVDVRRPLLGPVAPLRVQYRETPGEAFNNGHTVQVALQPGDALWVGDTEFGLLQFHFHWPAEHELRGRRPPAEIHLVHATSDGRLAVLGTWVEIGAENAAWNELWAHLPMPGDTTRMSFDLTRLFALPADLEHETTFRYCGSLTTEPYGEGVTWLMRATPIEMSAAQLARLRRAMHRYSRGVQPLGAREIDY